MGEIIAGILAAVLAAFGFYSLLRTVGELLRPPCPVTTAVLIRTRQELADLDLFLDEARHGARRRGYTPQVLIDRRLLVGMPGSCARTARHWRCWSASARTGMRWICPHRAVKKYERTKEGWNYAGGKERHAGNR